MNKIKEIKREMLGCSDDDHSADCAFREECFKPLIGDGPEDASIVILGEAPAINEMREGKPFVGRSGKLLNKMISEAGLSRKKVYVTNSIHTKLGDVKPKLKSIKACRKWVTRELELVQPNIVVLAGGIAAQSAGYSSTVKTTQGLVKLSELLIPGKKVKTITTYHPAAVLRNPRYRSIVVKDLKRAAKESKSPEITPPKRRNYVGLTTGIQIIDYINNLDPKLPVALDTETEGLKPTEAEGGHRSIRCISMTQRPYEAVAIITDNIGDDGLAWKALRDFFANPKFKKVLHNVKFDRNWIKHVFGVELEGVIFDTMIAHSVMNEDAPSHSLKALSAQHTDLGNYAEAMDAAVKEYGAHHLVPVTELVDYACADADAAMRLYKIFKKTDEYNFVMNEVILPSVFPLGDIELTGLNLDLPYLKRLEKKYKRLLDGMMEDFLSTTGVRAYNADAKKPFNPNSPKQVGLIVYGHYDLPVLELTDTGQPSTGKDIIQRLLLKVEEGSEPHTFLTVLADYKKLHKLNSTYIKGMKKHICKDGRIRSEFNLSGTKTGRLSSSNPNVQNIERGSDIRNMFTASEGCLIVQADYSQLEMRIGALYANETVLFDAFAAGRDVHTELAASIFQKAPEDIDKEERVLAKTVNFGIFYGRTPEAISEDLRIPLERAYDAVEAFFTKYKNVRSWIDETHVFVKKNGYVKSLFGRIRHLPLASSHNRGERNSALRMAVNFPVQSAASDVTLYSMVMLHTALKELGSNAKLIGEVHDSIMLDVPFDEVEDIIELTQATMEERWFDFIDVPLKVDVEIGERWGSLEKV